MTDPSQMLRTTDTEPPAGLHRLLADSVPVLIGVGGMLWRAWSELLSRRSVLSRSPGLEELDLTRPCTLEQAIPEGCRLVVNCAAYTDVDGAEKEESLAMAVNGTGVGELARVCRWRGALLVHYSTDYVFDGQATRPYRPEDLRNPLGAYGRSKALGEQLLEDAGCQYLLIRTSWLYAPWGKNFVRTIATALRQGKPLRVVDDQRGRPTSAEHLAQASLLLIEREARGIYHVTDGGECSWHEFACEIARILSPGTVVERCRTADLGRPAQRPAYSVLDLEKTERLIGPMPHWKTALASVLARLE